MHGKGVWVWYAAPCGTPEAMAAQAQAAGLSHVIIKVGDGGGFGDQFDREVFRRQFAEYAPPLRAAGLRVLTWTYNYLEDAAGEAAVVNWALANGSEGHVFNPEIESEKRPAEADELLRLVREAHPGAFLAYAPLPVIDYHQDAPYVQFNAACQSVAPQFYPTAFKGEWPLPALWEQWDRWAGVWKAWGKPMPELLPLVEGYFAESPAVIAEFAAQAFERGVPGWSVWSWQHLTPETWAAIAAAPMSGAPAVVGAPEHPSVQAVALAHIIEGEKLANTAAVNVREALWHFGAARELLTKG